MIRLVRSKEDRTGFMPVYSAAVAPAAVAALQLLYPILNSAYARSPQNDRIVQRAIADAMGLLTVLHAQVAYDATPTEIVNSHVEARGDYVALAYKED
jgi:hypothetical protein